ncbi:enoyl-CoA hydratase-related protein [Kibdelosporangium lantanae]
MPEESVVRLTREGAVATLTMTTVALTVAAKTALREAIDEVSADSSVRAVVLTGSGKAFCAGQDLGEHAAALQAGASTALDTVTEHYNPIVLGLVRMPKPVVASVNGLCFGAGLGFALACDLRIASSSARFGTAFTGIGLSLDSGLSVTLPRAVGAARASELVLLASPFTATDALNWGLVGQVVPPEELAASTTALASRLANGPTLAYAEAKRALAVSLEQALADEGAAQSRLGITEDHRNAVEAFVAKENPKFHGR